MKLFVNQLGLDFKKNHRCCLKTSQWLRVAKFTDGTKNNLFCQGILNSTKIVGEHRLNRIHLIPITKTQTWAKKGSKHVLAHGMENKLQVVVLVSTSTNLLPFQIIITGLIERSLPPWNLGQKMCEEVRWHLTCIDNHYILIWQHAKICGTHFIAIQTPTSGANGH